MNCEYYMVEVWSNVYPACKEYLLYKVHEGVNMDDFHDIILDDCGEVSADWYFEYETEDTIEADIAEELSSNRYSYLITKISRIEFEENKDGCYYYSEVGRC